MNDPISELEDFAKQVAKQASNISPGYSRDPARIPQILDLIEEIWTDHPDLRLCQLIGNCFPVSMSGSSDLYYVEDDKLAKKLKETYENGKT